MEASCGACGKQIDELPDLPHNDRAPCLACGATERTYRVSSSVTFAATSSMSVAVSIAENFSSLPNLLLQSVVTFASKTQEGRLVAAVTEPWFDIIAVLKADPAAAFQLPPEKWEEIVAGSYRKAGFTEVTLTPRSGDHGRDVIAVMHGIGSVRVIDQVKAYKPGHLVTANDVRAFCFVVDADRASKGFLTTTSDFARRIPVDPLLKPVISSRVELIDGKKLLSRLQDLAAARCA